MRYTNYVVVLVSIVKIEENIAHRILWQQKDVIAKHIGQIRERMCETHAREDLLVDNQYSSHNGEAGMYVRLEYSYKSRSWSLRYGEELKTMSRYWAAENFLHYDDSDESNWIWLTEQLIEGVVQDSLQEEY